MNIWIISVMIAGLMVVAGIAVVNAVIDSGQETIDCSGCGNSCSLESNCGLSSCAAVSGGSCGCGG